MIGIVGDVMIDQLAMIRDYPEEGSETIIRSYMPRLGGSACNTAMVLGDLTGRSLLFSQIGDDENGRFAMDALKRKGVATDYVSVNAGMETGFIIIMVSPDGSRTMVSRRPRYPLPDDEAAERRFVSLIDFLHLSGYVFLEERERAICERIIDKAIQKGLPISLDPGISPVKQVPQAVLSAIGRASYFLPNEKELLILTQTQNVLSGIVSLSPRNAVVVVKCGEKGCLIADHKTSLRVSSAKAVATNNSTGAGDAFNAGFIYGLSRQWSHEACGRLGNHMGLQVVSSPKGIAETTFCLP